MFNHYAFRFLFGLDPSGVKQLGYKLFLAMFLRRFFSRISKSAWLCGVMVGAGLPLAIAKPAPAAERVSLTYGFVEISASVESLRAYAERGEVSKELAPYLRFLGSTQREQFRRALQVRQNVGPVEISQFLNSSIGKNILRYLGNIIQTQGRRDGSKGLRGALVLAAAEPEGLSLLGVLEKFPTNTVRIDSQRAFQALNAFTKLIDDTDVAIAAITRQSSSADALNPSLPALGSLAQPGPFTVTRRTLTFQDAQRSRDLVTDLYLPNRQDAPLVVVSHGLAGDREGFTVVADHLASHGYAVAALDHPGSDRTRLEDLFAGIDKEVADPTEFSDRPYDVSFLIDELTRANNTRGPLSGQFDLDRISMIGHSFGGYTALALAGAQLDLGTLQANCESNDFIFNAANPSMVLQCTALLFPEQFTANLRDDRIKAIMAFNPVTSSLFGQRGFAQLAVPSLIVSGSDDPLAPALLEQIRPFIWLNRLSNSEIEALEDTTEEMSVDEQNEGVDSTEQQAEVAETIPGIEENASEENSVGNSIDRQKLSHYLAVIQGGSHLYEVPVQLEGTEQATLASELINADEALAFDYLKALSLGFLQAEIEQDPIYRSALNDASIVQLGREPLPLFFVNSLTEEMLLPLPKPATIPESEVAPTETVPPETVPDTQPDIPTPEMPMSEIPTPRYVPVDGSGGDQSWSRS